MSAGAHAPSAEHLPQDRALPEAEADMRRHLRFREAVFAAYEDLTVAGVPVASLVEETLDVDCSSGILREAGAQGIVLRAQRITLALWPLIERARGRRRRWPATVPPGRVLIDVASTGHNCRRIWEPIARQLGPERTVLLVPPRAPAQDRLAGFEWVTPAAFPVSWPSWRADVAAGYATWEARARGLAEHGVTERGARRLATTIALQALRVRQAEAVVEFYRPSALLSLADRGASGAPLVGAAKRQGVPTLTIAHCPAGRTFGRTFLPLNAERFLVWGEYQRAVFEEFGVGPERLSVVGNPGMEVPTVRSSPRPDPLGALGVPAGRRVLVLTGPMRDAWREAWFAEIREAARRLSGEAAFVVRVHPSERAEFYRERATSLGTLVVLDNATLALEDTLDSVDAVVVHGSSVGLDALVRGRDVFVLDCLPFTLGTMREVADAGAGALVHSGDALADGLREAWTHPERLAPQREAARQFVRGFLSAYGADAARSVVDEIDRAVAAPRC